MPATAARVTGRDATVRTALARMMPTEFAVRALTVAGAVLMGFVLAPLGTYYSLVFDALAPAHRRAAGR
jgi:hypothetical protein